MRETDKEAAGTPASAEHQGVVDFLAAVILEGLRKADSVAALAAKGCGQQFQPPTAKATVLLADEVPVGPIVDSVSNLGAALRIAQWEQAGLRPYLPSELPSAADAFRSIRNGWPKPDTHESADLSNVQFSVWQNHFVWHSRENLGSEVAQFGCPFESDAIVDHLAEFLWAHPLPASHIPDNKREAT